MAFDRRDDRKSGQGGFNRGGRGNFNRGPREDRGPREMHDVTCSECGAKTQVPFKPTEGRPVYCKDCFMKKKNSEE